MSMEMRKCRQCGLIKALDNYRPYYGGRAGHYRLCKDCEKVNSRHKYLTRKQTRKPDEEAELSKINQLYDILRERGLQPPNTLSRSGSLDLDALIQLHSAAEPVSTVPRELQEWLDKDIEELEDYELQDVYDDLEDKYRPQVGVDPVTFKPIFDETYKEILEKLEERFGL